MTYTYTQTLEERALQALCERQPVRLHEPAEAAGVVGVITGIHATTDSVIREVTIRELFTGVEHRVPLKLGTVECL